MDSSGDVKDGDRNTLTITALRRALDYRPVKRLVDLAKQGTKGSGRLSWRFTLPPFAVFFWVFPGTVLVFFWVFLCTALGYFSGVYLFIRPQSSPNSTKGQLL